MDITAEHLKFISDRLEKYTPTCDILDQFKNRFSHAYNTMGRKKIRDKIGYVRTRLSLNAPIPNNIQTKCDNKYDGICKFTDEQMAILTSNIPEHKVLEKYCNKFPQYEPNLKSFHVWILAAKYRKSADECKRVELETAAREKASSSESIMIPARITHKYDAGKPKIFADEGEVLVKILNVNTNISSMLSDLLVGQRKEVELLEDMHSLFERMLQEFTKAKELNQKKLDLIGELK